MWAEPFTRKDSRFQRMRKAWPMTPRPFRVALLVFGGESVQFMILLDLRYWVDRLLGERWMHYELMGVPAEAKITECRHGLFPIGFLLWIGRSFLAWKRLWA